jgi:hypothetical protein
MLTQSFGSTFFHGRACQVQQEMRLPTYLGRHARLARELCPEHGDEAEWLEHRDARGRNDDRVTAGEGGQEGVRAAARQVHLEDGRVRQARELGLGLRVRTA